MIDIARAEKKLRQATFFLGCLEAASREPITRPDPTDERAEQLEFYFSACLTAAQSAYYVLDETGGVVFNEIQKRWRCQLGEPAGSRFGRMIGMRGDDVHRARTKTDPLQKFVPEPLNRYSVYLGWDATVEAENPDGTKVRGSVLRGAIGLYIEQEGRRIEAADACREFIDQQRSLLEAVKATPGRTDRA